MIKSVAQWLEDQGLGQYAGKFAEHDIVPGLLAELDDADLKEIGVNALGHRKILLRAIGELPRETTSADDAGLVADDEDVTDITAWSRTPGERKPVTLLFADIVGSTAMTEELDAEEAHDLLYSATERMCQAVENNRGTVCRFMGDGIMAMFGAPRARELHALEACQAALEMRASVGRYAKKLRKRHGVGIEIRIGLHSGEVVLLEVGDDPARPEYDASGPTVPLAARMEQSADPGGILITDTTRAEAERWIETSDRGEISVKGRSKPVSVFALEALRGDGRPQAAGRTRPLVGRQAELAQFRGLLEVCRETGRGESLLIRGEAGIGKTRLSEELMRLARGSGFATYLAVVLDFGTGKGQAAFPSLVRDFLGIEPGSGKTARRQALDEAQRHELARAEQRVFLNDLLDLPQPLELRTLYDAMEARTRVEGKHHVVGDIVTRLAARRPLLLVIEGLHWADTETLDYLTHLARVVSEIPALLLMTSRLEDDPVDIAWRARAGEHPTVTWDLGPLRADEAMQLATGFGAAQDDFLRQCLERAEGNPLFLEQLLLVAGEGNLETVPDSIKSIVLARMDQLAAPDKLALRAASVLGQRFELDSLRHLVGNPDYDCRPLVDNHLVRPDELHFSFTHALIQGGVYASLLKNQRIELHRMAADWYGDNDFVLRAEHLDRAGDSAALEAYRQAALREAELYRPERALQLVRRALQIAAADDSFELRNLEGDLLRSYGSIPESIEAYRAAAAVAPDEVGRCLSMVGMAQGLAATAAHREAQEMLDQAIGIAGQHRLTSELARICRTMGKIHFYRGQIDACLEANQRSLDHARASGSVEVEARALSGLANAEYNRGRFISAQGYFDQCLELAREHGFGRILAANLSMRSYVSGWHDDIDSAIAGYREAARLAEQISDSRAQMMALMIGGSFWALVGDIEEGENWLNSSKDIIRRVGAGLFEGVCDYLLGRFALLRGDSAEARRLVERGVSTLRESESGMTFGGPIALGILALAANSETQCHAALTEAEAMLAAGSVGHNYLNFYEDAMEACLQIGAWDEVDRYARALEEYTRPEPLPRSDYFIARGRGLAAFGRGERGDALLQHLQELDAAAEINGFHLSRRALDAAIRAT